MNPAQLAALVETHLDLLYVRDAADLILSSRDPDVPTPLVHLVRTPHANRWLLSAALPPAERSRLDDALSSEAVIADIAAFETQPPILTIAALNHLWPGASLNEHRGPAFYFAGTIPAPSLPVELLDDPPTTPTVPELSWITTTGVEAAPLAIARDNAGQVVAVCHSARSTSTGAEAGVETAPDYRGRGLAVAVVSLWAQTVRAEGRLALYSTDWMNLASRSVANKLALIPYAEDYSAHYPGTPR